MEILHSNAKRTVLATLDDSIDGDVFCAHLANNFNVVRVGSPAEALNVLYERARDLSVVIIDINMAEENDFAFLRTFTSERRFDTIPVLIASRRKIDESDLQCLEEGAFDFILPPHHLGLTKRRVENAVNMKRAETFHEIESILRRLPSNIFLKDTEGRYVFMTHYWHHIDMQDDPDWTIRGKTDLEIRRDSENAEKAMETDREVVRTGKGTSYILESNVDGVREFVKLYKEPVFDEDGNVTGIVALINDVTETELLRRELERRVHTDELTGLDNRRAFSEYIDSIADAAGYPLTVISADCDRLKYVNDTYGHLVGDEYIRMGAMVLKDCLPETARVFRLGGDEFMAFVPDTTLEQARALIEDIRVRCEATSIQGISVSLSCGAAVVSGPDDDVDAAISAADHAMYADKDARKIVRGQ